MCAACYNTQNNFFAGTCKKASFEDANLQDYGHLLTMVGFNEAWAQVIEWGLYRDLCPVTEDYIVFCAPPLRSI